MGPGALRGPGKGPGGPGNNARGPRRMEEEEKKKKRKQIKIQKDKFRCVFFTGAPHSVAFEIDTVIHVI
jgi:hypothetical protein